MLTDVYWIETPGQARGGGQIGQMPRPRGGDWLGDEVAALARAGVTALASLLTDEEVAELVLDGEPDACAASGIHFSRVPVSDRGLPADDAALDAAACALADRVRDGERVVTHCRLGVGRASLLSGAALIRLGLTADEALRRIEIARGRPVPDTPAQRRWLIAYARRVGDEPA